MKKKILIFGAHPDDCEIGMGGTIKKLSNNGSNITIIDLTQGEMSSNGNIFLRQKESEAASLILGIKERINLKLPDRNIENSKSNVERIANVIRKHKPDIVYLPSSIDTHPDHVSASLVIQESIFHAKLRKFVSEFDPVDVKNSYMYHINTTSDSDFFVDITNEMCDKVRALNCYKSQFDNQANESTRLTNGFLKQVESNNNVLGYKCGTQFAEGFITIKPILLRNISSMEAILND